jgi:hypothetical protein
VRTCHLVLPELAGDTLLDEMADAEGDLGDVLGGDGRLDRVVTVGWEDWRVGLVLSVKAR